MKLSRLVYIISLFVLASCSNTAIVSHHWAKYVNSNLEITNLSSSLNNKPFIQPIRLEENVPNKDSIIIVTKTGKTCKGIVSKSDYDGYFIKIENNREIYISNLEIKSIQFIKNPPVINTQYLPTDPNPDTAIIKTTISTEKVAEPSNNNSLENDVWDNANSEFEISNSNSPQHVFQAEEISSKKVQEPLSILSFIFTLLGFITGVGFLLGMIFGAISLSKIKKNPEKFKGKGIAKFSFILSTAVVAAVLFLFLLIVAILL
ncbi:MAG: DUF4190 domain-containing protein [Flavobacteriales bacterium]|nr:DUF4190 domain-containing protein [Flavobacteriales bacterium]